ncbi:hypothetical protein M1615_02145 [Patescibacteria group bacterium]|nr:hypothetical protein [Patescibacteria group bacterium]
MSKTELLQPSLPIDRRMEFLERENAVLGTDNAERIRILTMQREFYSRLTDCMGGPPTAEEIKALPDDEVNAITHSLGLEVGERLRRGHTSTGTYVVRSKEGRLFDGPAESFPDAGRRALIYNAATALNQGPEIEVFINGELDIRRRHRTLGERTLHPRSQAYEVSIRGTSLLRRREQVCHSPEEAAERGQRKLDAIRKEIARIGNGQP